LEQLLGVLHDEEQEAHVEQAAHEEDGGQEEEGAGQGGGQQQVNYRLVEF
jgi:hypothetical protein